MVLFKDSLAQWAPVRKDGSQNANGTYLTISFYKPLFLTIYQALNKEFVENAVQLLVTRFIPLNPSDLEEWVSDPEGWVNLEEQDNEQWVFEIRVRCLHSACVASLHVFRCSRARSGCS